MAHTERLVERLIDTLDRLEGGPTNAILPEIYRSISPTSNRTLAQIIEDIEALNFEKKDKDVFHFHWHDVYNLTELLAASGIVIEYALAQNLLPQNTATAYLETIERLRQYLQQNPNHLHMIAYTQYEGHEDKSIIQLITNYQEELIAQLGQQEENHNLMIFLHFIMDMGAARLELMDELQLFGDGGKSIKRINDVNASSLFGVQVLVPPSGTGLITSNAHKFAPGKVIKSAEFATNPLRAIDMMLYKILALVEENN